jgi:hypothetical protein
LDDTTHAYDDGPDRELVMINAFFMLFTLSISSQSNHTFAELCYYDGDSKTSYLIAKARQNCSYRYNFERSESIEGTSIRSDNVNTLDIETHICKGSAACDIERYGLQICRERSLS